jgi:1-acyl-sn-glycerol-3-phosphate acyltransferase
MKEVMVPDTTKDDLGRVGLCSWIATPIFVGTFFGILLVFHPLQVLASFISRRLQKHVLDLMNLSIILNVRFLGLGRLAIEGNPQLPEGRSVIMISNHQSMYDIPMIMWFCRKRELGFIAKKELGKWIPSISFALRTLGSVLIDRKDAKVALQQIYDFGCTKEREKQVACIFPEGTRARDGVMKRFKTSGVQTLVKAMPSAIIQPVVIDGNWKLFRYNLWPVPLQTSVVIRFLEPLEPNSVPQDSLTEVVESRIRAGLAREG